MSWSRFLAILIKEFRQVRRDRLTFGMMVGVPIIQLILFGFNVVLAWILFFVLDRGNIIAGAYRVPRGAN